MSNKPKFFYANSMGISQCKRVCEFYFGAFFFRAEIDKKERCFYIYLFTKIFDMKSKKTIYLDEEVDVEWFDEFWCKDKKQWVIKRISPEETINVEL